MTWTPKFLTERKRLREEDFFSLLFGIGTLCFFYALANNELSTTFLASASLGAAWYAATLVAIIIEWEEHRSSTLPIKKKFWILLAFIFPSLIIGGMLYGIGFSTINFLSWALSSEKFRPIAVTMISLYTLGAGGLLFVFRHRTRVLYGITEIAAGIAVAVHRVISANNISLTDPGFHLAILTAGIYLVVRGFDNIHQGWTKDPIDPVAAHFLRKFRSNGDMAKQSPR